MVAAVLVYVCLRGHEPFSAQIVAAWDAFALVQLIVVGVVLSTKDPYEMRRTASLQDSNRTLLFALVIVTTIASFFAVFVLLGSTKNLSGIPFAIDVGLSVTAIVLSWLLVHALFGLHYAHLYYIDARKLERDKIEGGLLFPGKELPGFPDFAYFSFVVGMTCQVSDVQVASKRMRQFVTLHGLISFGFNTTILAVVVNIVAGLI